jgi:Ca2+-binding RTX toxin-like protein
MIADNKTIYFILGDLDTPALPAKPQSEDANKHLLQAFVSLFKDFLYESAENITDESIKAFSKSKLKELSAEISANMKANPELAAEYTKVNDFEQIALKWKEFAVSSGSPSAASVAAYCDAIVSHKQDAVALLQQAPVDSTKTFRAARLLGAAAGQIVTALEVAGAVQDGATDPDKMLSQFAGIIVGGIAGGLLLSALGGVGAVLALPAGAAVAVGLTVLVAAYAAEKIGEFIWDEFISDNFWAFLDSYGVKDDVKQFISNMGYALDAIWPGDPESPPYKTQKEYDGDVTATNEEQNIVVGNDGRNEINMLYGRTVAFGDGGDDIYRVYSTAKGNQVISDTEGSNTLLFGIEDIASLTFEKVSGDVFQSAGGNYTITLVRNGANSSLVVTNKYYDASVVILEWSSGGFGINLPGFEQPPPADSVLLTGGADVFGTDGNNAGNDKVNALSGNDGLSGGAGDDRLDGGAGDDLIFGGSGNDTIIGGDGNDEIIDSSEEPDFRDLRTTPDNPEGTSEYSRFQDRIANLGSALAAHGTNWFVQRTIVSNTGNPAMDEEHKIFTPVMAYLDPNASPSGDDIIDAGAGNDRVFSGEGDDIVVAGTGSDYVNGGHDDDTISGGGGDDVLDGDMNLNNSPGGFAANVSSGAVKNGSDTIDGGEGNDIVRGGGGGDTLYGGGGNDEISGRGQGDIAADADDADNDYIDGGLGNDLIFGDDGDDTILGGADVDNIRGDNGLASVNAGNDDIDAGDGDDTARGDGGDDHLKGGNGADTLWGDAIDIVGDKHGRDSLSGGDGNDTLIGQGGIDTLYGDAGDDLLVGDMDISQLAAQYHGADMLFGGLGNDSIYGNGGDDTLDGGAGFDTLVGGTGDDRLSGGSDNDMLYGGEGNDILRGGDGADQMAGNEGDDSLFGGAGDDIMQADAGDDTAEGGLGNDVIDGGDGNDTFFGGDGNDYLDGDAGNDYLAGGDGNDSAYGGADNDTLYGDAGNDGLNGAEGNDVLYGGAGSDTLWGMEGNDVFDGGIGDDVMSGGAGVNVYMYDGVAGHDHILAEAAAGSIVRIGSGVNLSDLVFYYEPNGSYSPLGQGGPSLSIFDSAFTSSIKIWGFAPDASSTVTHIQLPDGTLLDYQAVFDRINAGYFAGTTNHYAGSNLDDSVQGRTTADEITGSGGNDTLYGNDGDDGLSGGDGDDLLDGGQGNDTLSGGNDNDILRAGAGNDYVSGGQGSDVLEGGDGNDSLNGASVWDDVADIDTFYGGRGNDRLSGGNGVDIYVYNRGDGSDIILENGHLAEHGIDTLRFGTGIAMSDLQFFRTGSNSLDIGSDEADDLVILINGGPDQIRISSFFEANQGGFKIERIEFDNGNDISLDLAQIVAMTQDFGVENVMQATAGNDTFLVDDRRDRIVDEFSTTDRDTVISSVSFALYETPYVDDLQLTGALDIDAEGNDRDNVVTGNSGNNTIETGLGNDTVDGGNGDDTIYDSHGNNILRGGDGRDIITADGISGSNQIFGDAGDDTLSAYGNAHMDGGSGSDTFVVMAQQSTNQNRTLWIHENAVDTAATDVLDVRALYASRETAMSDIKIVRSPALGQAWVQVLNTRIYVDTDANGNLLVEYLRISDTEQVRLQDLLVVNDAPVLQGTIGSIYVPKGPSTQIDVLRSAIANEAWDTLVFTADYLPEGWSIDSATGVITVVDNGVGGSAFTVTATDGSGQTLSIPLEFVHYTVVEGTAGADSLSDSAGNSVIRGYEGNDTLTGNSSLTRLYGGIGDDIYHVYSGGTIFENANEGTDTVNSRGYVYTLGQNLENLNLASTSAEEGHGNVLDNVINGNSNNNVLYGHDGNDTIDGKTGDDLLVGGTGNDIYTVDSSGDIIVEQAGEGTDAVRSSVTHTLAVNVENLTLTGSGIINGTGNALDNVIAGNSAANTLSGGDGNDTLIGGAGIDTLVGGLGNDVYVVDVVGDVVTEQASAGTDTVQTGITYTLASLANVEHLTLTGSGNINGTGNANANVLTGNAGNNILDGGTGADTLIGAIGNDTYVVDLVSDVVTELAGEGVDLVQTSVSYTLSANVENMTLSGTSNINATGNAENNVLTGNTGNNTLTGGAGNDALNGGAGIDTLVGGTGDDTYTVDTTTDVITELAGEGTDTVSTGITFDLTSRANIENLTLTGTGTINGTGNSLNNVLIGNGANNTLNGGLGNDVLDGGLGNDTMIGGAGDDTYYVNVSTDVVTESSGGGTDTVNAAITYTIASAANLENINLTGTSAINATGNGLANVLIGNSNTNAISAGAGNDTLDGGAGTDTLTGGTGNDTYRMARGYGVDTVVENDAAAGNYDVAKFLTGIAFDQLWFRRPTGSNNLEITIIGTSDKMVVKDWYLGAQYRTEEIQVDDGNRYLLAADVQTLVTAMASMTAPPLGQTTLSASQLTALNAALTAAWKTRTTIVMSSLPAEAAPANGQSQNLWLSATTPALFDTGSSPHGLNSLWSLLRDAPPVEEMNRFMATGGNATAYDASGTGLATNCALPAGVVDWDMPLLPDCGIALVQPDCGKPSTNRAATLSTCNRLVDLMAMSDGDERELAFTSFRGRDRNDQWIP